MSYSPDQNDINLLYQATKQVYAKVEILNRDYIVIQNIEGQLIDDSYNVDAKSNVRRSYNCRLQITSPILDFDKDSVIWFDKYIRPYVGIYDIRRKKVIWYLKGTYSSVNATHTFDASTNTLSLTCNDLMCRLTGDLDGKQTGLSFTIPTGEDIRTSLIGILKVFGFTKYKIEELPRRVQHDLEFSAGATAYDMISSLMEFCPNFEFFFDIDGTFVVQRIPCYTNDIDILTDDVLQELLVSQDSYTVGFSAKNCVEVWGRSYDEESVDRMAESCTYSGNTYSVKFGGEKLTSLPDYLLFAATIETTNAAGCSMTITDSAGTNLGTFTIYDEYDRTLSAGLLEANTTYLFFMDVDSETVPANQMNIRGTYSVSTTYSYNDVVISTVDDKNLLYIARPANESETFSGKPTTDKAYWNEIVFSSAYELMGEYSASTTYQPTQMVLYNGVLYCCMKTDTVGKTPGDDETIWSSLNMNVNTIKHGNRLRFRGNMTAHAIYKNESGSKFSVEDMGREYWEVYSGGEYDNITSDMLAKERAMYECYYKANLNEALSLTLVDIPWLDVNKKVSYTRQWNDKPERWMINTVSSETLSGTCSVTLNKFYPDWSEVFQSDFV